MSAATSRAVLAVVCAVQVGAIPVVLHTQEAPASAITWLDHRQEIEDYLKVAKVVRTEDTGTGVTHPKHAFLAPGGPIGEMAWKPLPAGKMMQGYRESYKTEIAAYEMDKLIELNMVPPTVQRKQDGEEGAAIMWASPTKTFKMLGGVPTPPPQQAYRWTVQLVKAKMFDNLVGNLDPNLGNWLVDPAWNIILIDHSRALGTGTQLTHKLEHVYAPLWDKMKALTEDQVNASLGPWLEKKEIEAIFKRREAMQKEFDALVKKSSEAAVYLK